MSLIPIELAPPTKDHAIDEAVGGENEAGGTKLAGAGTLFMILALHVGTPHKLIIKIGTIILAIGSGMAWACPTVRTGALA